MANSRGGVVLLGVADNAKTVGLSNPLELKKNFGIRSTTDPRSMPTFSRAMMYRSLNMQTLSVLTKLGGWRECKQTGQKGVTVAAMLMFGREESIRNAVPQCFVDYRERLSEDPYVRSTDRFMVDGTWAGN